MKSEINNINNIIKKPTKKITEPEAWRVLRKHTRILSDTNKTSKIQIIKQWKSEGLIKESNKSW